MNILLIGGAGFIGRWVLKKLLEKGHKVTVFDNLSWGKDQIRNIQEFLDHPQLTYVEGNIENPEELHNVFQKNPDLCIHMASFNIVQKSIENPKHAFDTDVLGTFNIAEECRKNKTRMIFISTCMVYDMVKGDPITELHPIKPISPYSAAKIAAENIVLSYYHTYGMNVNVLRPFNTYGPFGLYPSGEGTVIPRFLNNFLHGKPLEIFGDGLQTRDFLYVEDTANFIIAAAENTSIKGEIINGGSGTEISIKDLAKLIQPDASKINFITHHHPQSDVRRLLCDSSKAKKLLGFVPKTDLKTGLAKTKEWMLELQKKNVA